MSIGILDYRENVEIYFQKSFELPLKMIPLRPIQIEKPMPLKERMPEVLSTPEGARLPEIPAVAPLPSADFTADEGEYFNFEI